MNTDAIMPPTKIITCAKCGRVCWRKRPKQTRCEDCRQKDWSAPKDRSGDRRYKARNQSPAAVAKRNAMVKENLEIARICATKMFKRIQGKVDMGDLLSGACMGLMNAADRFDPDRGVKFTTFARPHVEGGILDEMRAIDPAMRLQRTRGGKFERAGAAFYAREGRNPTEPELQAELGLSDEQYELEKVHAIGGHFLREADGPDTIPERGGYVQDDAERADWWRAATAGLTRTDKTLVLLLYRDGMTMKEVGKFLGLSESRISQLHANLMARLRESPVLKRLLAAEVKCAA